MEYRKEIKVWRQVVTLLKMKISEKYTEILKEITDKVINSFKRNTLLKALF